MAELKKVPTDSVEAIIAKQRDKWNIEQVPGCKQPNCSRCQFQKSPKVMCALQKRALKKMGLL